MNPPEDVQRDSSGKPLRPWAALWSLVLGFFMILVDSTIVAVANPSIMHALNTTMTATLWATSAYLLAYAVPLLITGRLGDRFGPKRMYLSGLTLFTLASLGCGFASDIWVLIGARVLQGLGASMVAPQTMSVVTRIFEPKVRGSAMAVWGVTTGVATLAGPLLGGLILGPLSWEWIFFINVPIGIVAFVLALRFVPRLPTSEKRFDWLGVALSALGMLLVVFSIQEGSTFAWGTIWGPITVPGVLAVGVVILALFTLWQKLQRGEPLIPLRIFRDRNFSVGSVAILTVGMSVLSLNLPLMFYLQLVHGLTPFQSALILVPKASAAVILARPVGKIIDRKDPRRVPVIGMLLVSAALLVLVLCMLNTQLPLWVLLVPSLMLGIGQAFMWGPLALLTTFNLNPKLAGAGSGVYNMSRQVGAVLGASAMAGLMSAMLAAQFGPSATSENLIGNHHALEGSTGTALPEAAREGFATAMAQSMMLPMTVIALGAVVALFFLPRTSRLGTA